MANYEFTDNHLKVESQINESILRFLEEASGELEAMTKRNTRPMDSYDVKNSWIHKVDENKMEAIVGSPLEAAYWEEFGTGEHAIHKDGRKGWWVYVKGNEIPREKQKRYTKAEAMEAAERLKKMHLDAYATDGMEANRPLERAYESVKPKVAGRLSAIMKGIIGK